MAGKWLIFWNALKRGRSLSRSPRSLHQMSHLGLGSPSFALTSRKPRSRRHLRITAYRHAVTSTTTRHTRRRRAVVVVVVVVFAALPSLAVGAMVLPLLRFGAPAPPAPMLLPLVPFELRSGLRSVIARWRSDIDTSSSTLRNVLAARHEQELTQDRSTPSAVEALFTYVAWHRGEPSAVQELLQELSSSRGAPRAKRQTSVLFHYQVVRAAKRSTRLTQLLFNNQQTDHRFVHGFKPSVLLFE